MRTSICLFLCTFLFSACGGTDPAPAGVDGGDANVGEAGPLDGDAELDGALTDGPSSDAVPDAPIGDSAGPDAPSCDYPQEVLDFAESWAQTTCSAMGSCCTQEGLSFKTDECVNEYLKYLPYTIPCDVVFHPELVSDCLEQLATWYGTCDPNVNSDLWWELEYTADDTCSRVLEGRGEPGDHCTTSGDCKNPPEGRVTCLWDGGDQYCQWILPGEEGESCEFMSNELVTTECFITDGLYCDIGGTETCQPMGDAGEPCSKSFSPSCLHDIACDSSTETCMQPLGTGDACDPTKRECEWGDYCAGSTQTCTSRAPAGSPCSEDEECLTYKCVAGICSTYHHGMPSDYEVCEPPV